jgi:hypothetical protein
MSPGRDRSHKQQVEHQSQDAPEPSSLELPPDVLADVVAETAAQLDASSPVDPALHACLLKVAREYTGQAMTVEPTGAALLAALLEHQFPFLRGRPQLLSGAARSVAQSLLADPAARLRMEHLWAKLLEDVA